MRYLSGCLSIVLLSYGCGASTLSSPTAPSVQTASSATTAPFPPPAPPGTTRALTGAVRDAGNVPVAGAKVIVLAVGWYGAYTTEASAVTDGNGNYTMPEVRAYAGGDSIGWLLVGASSPGYFSDFKWWLDFPEDADLTLRLEPWTQPIRLDEVIQGEIGSSECAGLGYGGWYGQRALCQRFALTVPASGTLDVRVSAPIFAFDVDIVRPDGSFAAYAASSTGVRITTRVDAGLTYEIRVAGGWSPARHFELTAALR